VPRYFSLQLRFLLQGIHFDNHWGLLLLLLLTEVLHDANPKVPSRYLRRTLLHLAAAFSESAVILLYKRFGAELAVNAVDEENNTPLHLACNEKVVLHLLMGGADWSAQNKRGQFPSQTAAPAARQVLRTDSPCTLLLGMLLPKVLTQPGGGRTEPLHARRQIAEEQKERHAKALQVIYKLIPVQIPPRLSQGSLQAKINDNIKCDPSNSDRVGSCSLSVLEELPFGVFYRDEPIRLYDKNTIKQEVVSKTTSATNRPYVH
jgi:hypothetical protein